MIKPLMFSGTVERKVSIAQDYRSGISYAGDIWAGIMDTTKEERLLDQAIGENMAMIGVLPKTLHLQIQSEISDRREPQRVLQIFNPKGEKQPVASYQPVTGLIAQLPKFMRTALVNLHNRLFTKAPVMIDTPKAETQFGEFLKTVVLKLAFPSGSITVAPK